MRTRTSPARRPAATRMAVEYPQEGELITSSRYTFRIDASAPRVEIAIDGDDWAPCRRRDDYWCLDWSDYAPGRHQAVVRAAPRAGLEAAPHIRRFIVELPGSRVR
jgi:hypothetical protein